MRGKLYILVAAMMVLTHLVACTADVSDSDVTTQESRLKLNISVENFGAGTASTRVDQDGDGVLAEVNNLLILRFEGSDDSSVLSNSFYYDGDDVDQILELDVYGSYTSTLFVFIANGFGQISVPSDTTLGTFKSMGFAVDTSILDSTQDNTLYADGLITKDADGQRYFVMSDSYMFDYGIRFDDEIDVQLKRNVAKVSITVTNNIAGYDISGVSLNSMPSTSLYYNNYEGELADDEQSENIPSTVSGTVRYILSDEESSIKKGESITLSYFVPVNMRGIVDEFEDETYKAYYAPSGATYVYVTIPNTEGEEGEYYAYRFYLGANQTNNYNLEPNKQYDYSFTFNSLGDVTNDSRVTLMEAVTLISNDFTELKSSNCYILNPSENFEIYYIPIAPRINEYWGSSTYGDDPTNEIEDEDITSWTYEVLWYDNAENPINATIGSESELSQLGEDEISIYKCLKGSDDKTPSLAVTLGAGFDNWGNVLVAVKKDGAIIWSWHFWITDYDPYNHGFTEDDLVADIYELSNQTGALHRYTGTVWSSGGIYDDKYIMDRNIGARSATISPASEAGHLYYQFGRKDPFPYSATKVNDPAICVSSTTIAPVSISTAIANPTTKYYGSSNWCDENTGTGYLWNDKNLTDLNAEEKSIFDPSPYGFRLPISSTWNDMELNSVTIEGSANSNAGYGLYFEDSSSNKFLYPACGYIANNATSYKITSVNSYTVYISATATNGNSSYEFSHAYSICKTTVGSTQPYLNRSSAASLRCIEDE
ncbi:MAG: hypothetical protein SNH94_06575 [Rikenellaceae bacterium]